MIIVGGQVYDDVIPFVVGIDGMETKVRVGLLAKYESVCRL